MKYALSLLVALPLLLAAGPASPATRPCTITLVTNALPAAALLDELAKQAGSPLPLVSSDLLGTLRIPPQALRLQAVPFWRAAEEVSRSTGLEPVTAADDQY